MLNNPSVKTVGDVIPFAGGSLRKKPQSPAEKYQTKYIASLFKEFFVGIIIKVSAASLKVTDLLFGFTLCQKIDQKNCCPRSLAIIDY